MSLLDRTVATSAASGPSSRHLALVEAATGRTGNQLLVSAVSAQDDAEREFDRSPETRAELEQMYLLAAQALQEEDHPDLGVAWLGPATVRRYQKGRRDDALAAPTGGARCRARTRSTSWPSCRECSKALGIIPRAARC